MASWGRARRRRAMAAVGCAAMLGLVAACGSGAGSQGSAAAPEPPSAEVQFDVPDGATGVSVTDPVTLSVDQGTLTDVTMTNPQGEPVGGELAPDGLSWTSSEPLGYASTYTVTAQARGESGPVTETEQFTTFEPSNQTMAYMLPYGGMEVGVGQPAVIKFDEPIPDRQAAQDAITITTDPHVDGAFYWMSDKEVHWRPEDYWQPGTEVRVSVDTYGKDLGGGLYGQEDVDATFTIGDRVIAVADDSTKQITVKRGGQVVRTMPTSMGKAKYPTPNGVYIIGEQLDDVTMDSSTFGLPIGAPDGYQTDVKWATRMSYGGVFVHSAPWSVWAQGNTDTSHGCLNVSPTNAEWFYNNLTRGDLVIVKNTSGGTLRGTEGLGDWNIPWEKWKAGNAEAA